MRLIPRRKFILTTSMTHHDSITAFIKTLPRGGKSFFLGAWLASLSNEALEDLRAQVARVKRDDDDNAAAVEDLVLVGQTALAAEKGKPSALLTEEMAIDWIDALGVTAAIEDYRRRGWLTLVSPLSIQAKNKVGIRITEEGKKHGASFGSVLH